MKNDLKSFISTINILFDEPPSTIKQLFFNLSGKIFVDVRKCIDRLQHINDEGVLPKKMLKSKNKTEVTLFIQNIIDNDEVYGQFDESIDDDADYVALTSGSIVERMDLFVKENLHSFNSTLLKPKLNTKMFQMNKRSMLIEVNFKYHAYFFLVTL